MVLAGAQAHAKPLSPADDTHGGLGFVYGDVASTSLRLSSSGVAPRVDTRRRKKRQEAGWVDCHVNRRADDPRYFLNVWPLVEKRGKSVFLFVFLIPFQAWIILLFSRGSPRTGSAPRLTPNLRRRSSACLSND